ncbi:MAG: Spy/CpxP family protein refolding chaperone [Acidobacteriota bacterium]
MRHRWLTLGLLASLALNAGLLVALMQRGARHHRHMSPPDLGLSPAVQARWDENFEGFRSRMDALRAELRAEREKMLVLLASDDCTPEALSLHRARLQDLTDRLFQTVTEHLLEQKKLLNPEQRKRFFAALRDHMPDSVGMFPHPPKEKRP